MLEAAVANPFFSALLSGTSDEAYVIDAARMTVACASAQALKSHRCSAEQIQRMPMDKLVGMSAEELARHCSAYFGKTAANGGNGNSPRVISLAPSQTDKARRAGDSLRLSYFEIGERQWVLVFKNSANRNAMQALDDSESRFKALVVNTPGLVFQFRLAKAGGVSFVYLSDACMAVLGVEAIELKQSPTLLHSLISAEDRDSFTEALRTSAADLTLLNWEGRIWIEAWQDTKWINLRGSPMKMSDGGVQWGGIITNITQSKLEKLEIEQSRERMAELSAHLTQVKEQERRRIAREIHDDLGGNLTAIKIGLNSIINRLDSQQHGLIEKGRNLESIVDQTFDVAHRIASDLRPDILELGLVAALEWQARQFEKQISLPCHFQSNVTEVGVTPDEAITLFRICQEAMSNIAKHAQAEHVEIALSVSEGDIQLQITDDGVGIRPTDQNKSNSFGLRGMHERVSALEGSLQVKPARGKGTRITVSIPRTVRA